MGLHPPTFMACCMQRTPRLETCIPSTCKIGHGGEPAGRSGQTDLEDLPDAADDEQVEEDDTRSPEVHRLARGVERLGVGGGHVSHGPNVVADLRRRKAGRPLWTNRRIQSIQSRIHPEWATPPDSFCLPWGGVGFLRASYQAIKLISRRKVTLKA